MGLCKFIPALCMILGLTKPSITVDSDCNYKQIVQPGITYYVYNPGFPNYYQGQHSCLWKASSSSRMKLDCKIFTVPGSPNCTRDSLTVQVEDNVEYKLCGLHSFVLESVTTEMNIRFHSKYNTPGGKFRCELTAIEEECSCGRRNPNRIVGGVETGVNEYTMMAGLVRFPENLLYCGATIITEKHVITAAHCVEEFRNSSRSVGVLVGDHDITTGDDTQSAQLYFVERIVIHPDYIAPTTRADLAVLTSSGTFKFSLKVGPVCLPFYYTRTNFTGNAVTVLGWGTVEFGGKRSNTLMKADLKVISQNRCSVDYNDILPGKICAYADGKDACQLDSGGPMLWENPRTNRLTLLGLISYGKTCADGYPNVNTRVSYYLNFILEQIRGYSYCKAY